MQENLFDPDCILLDVRMAGISGLDALPILKTSRPLTPVIMLTALTDLEIGIESMRRGAFDYLTKPIHKAQLVEAARKAIHYREVMVTNERLERENREYQSFLELKIEERTAELFSAYQKLQKTNLTTVKVLAETIEAKDPYTRGHCNRVRMLSESLYRHIGNDEKERDVLEYGSLLHDIGKIGVREGLLNKNGKLTAEEIQAFNQHPIIGENILSSVEFFRPCLPIVRSHHEWYNGQGYPDGLRGGEIGLLVRIVSIADAYDAMTSTRPYREALPAEEALKRLVLGKGTQFDPEFVDLFIRYSVHEGLTSARSAEAFGNSA